MTPCHENAPFATRPHRIRSASPAVQPCRRFSLAAPMRTSSLPGRRERSLPVPLAGARGILRHAAEEEGVPPPKLPGVKVPKAQPVPVPTENERRRLLASYNPQACVVLVLAYQGSPHGRDPRARLAARGLPPWHHLARVRGHQERQGADGADAPEGCRSCPGGCGRPPGARNPARCSSAAAAAPTAANASRAGQPAGQGARHGLPAGGGKGLPRPRLAARLGRPHGDGGRGLELAHATRRLGGPTDGATLRSGDGRAPVRGGAPHRMIPHVGTIWARVGSPPAAPRLRCEVCQRIGAGSFPPSPSP
jgi:hypothetical protein